MLNHIRHRSDAKRHIHTHNWILVCFVAHGFYPTVGLDDTDAPAFSSISPQSSSGR